jgi:tetratricopeptide (TPR) repeat protein
MAAQTSLKGIDSTRVVMPVAVFVLVLAVGCAGAGRRVAPVHGGALHISEVAAKGDPLRRASTRLVLEGLSAGEPQRALSHYERAIKIDATNPYAYLALASYQIQWGDVARGMQSLNQAELLLESEELKSPRVEPHLTGLHGRARVRMRRDTRAVKGNPRISEGEPLLERARRLAPEAWGDGWLTASELQ